MCRGGTIDILVERFSRLSYQAGEEEADKRKETHGCGEREHADSWCEKESCRGQTEMEEDDSLL